MKNLITTVLLLITSTIFAQSENDKKILMDSLWKETTAADYKYYRIIKDYNLEKESYVFSDYYKSGKVYMETLSKSKYNLFHNEKEVIKYHENGNKKIVETYNKGELNGTYSEWYENGNKRLKGENIENKDYTKPSELKINLFWNSKNVQTVIDGNGDYEENNELTQGFGKVKNGFKDGEWKGKDRRFKSTYTESYLDAKLHSGISIDSNKVAHEYKILEIKPEFKNRMTAFYKFVGNNFRTPEDPKFKGGKVLIGFTINLNGKMVNPKILKNLTPEVDKEALILMNKFVEHDFDWIIAEIRGIKYAFDYVLPISLVSNEE